MALVESVDINWSKSDFATMTIRLIFPGSFGGISNIRPLTQVDLNKIFNSEGVVQAVQKQVMLELEKERSISQKDE